MSSAITNRPWLFACFSAALTASPLVVIRMPLSPREIALSIAVIWVWVSPSLVPAATVRSTLSLAAAALASFCMDTKYGLDSVLRISETPTFLPVDPPPAAAAPPALVGAAARRGRRRRGTAALVGAAAAEVEDALEPLDEPQAASASAAVAAMAAAPARRVVLCRRVEAGVPDVIPMVAFSLAGSVQDRDNVVSTESAPFGTIRVNR